MAATLSDLQARLETLKKALSSGVLITQHGDSRVQYRSVDEIRTAMGEIQKEIDLLGGNGIVRSFKLTSSKDL